MIVVDETWVKVGGKEAWIYVALDPRTLKVVYLQPFFVRDEGTAEAFLEHLVEAYGEWPREVITDGGWLWAAFSFWQVEGESSPRRGEIGDRGVLRGVPKAVDQGLRSLFPHQRFG